jgi:hypothetical protein
MRLIVEAARPTPRLPGVRNYDTPPSVFVYISLRGHSHSTWHILLDSNLQLSCWNAIASTSILNHCNSRVFDIKDYGTDAVKEAQVDRVAELNGRTQHSCTTIKSRK